LAAGGAQVSTLLSDVLHWQMILLILVTLESGEALTILVALQLDLLGRTVFQLAETDFERCCLIQEQVNLLNSGFTGGSS